MSSRQVTSAGIIVALASVSNVALYILDDKTASATERYLDGVRLGDGIELVAYKLSEDALKSGGILRLTLYWQALRQMDQDYTVFTHRIDSSNQTWAQHDGPPQGGSIRHRSGLRAKWSLTNTN